MKQPQVRRYLHWLGEINYYGNFIPAYDEKSCQLIDELFELVMKIRPVSSSKEGVRSLWFTAERGTFEELGDPEEIAYTHGFDSVEEAKEDWTWQYPDEVEWYQFQAVELPKENYRAVMLSHEHVIVQSDSREKYCEPYDISEFVQWLIESTKKCIDMLKAGTYNEFVRKNLPPQHKVGTISRKDFWDVWPEHRESFFKDISREDVEEFCRLAYAQVDDPADYHERLKTMTANDFYRFCAMAYAANNYKGTDKTPKEQYYMHADGRDNELKGIDGDSPEAFHEWLHDRTHWGGHPWEIMRGGNSTHVSLYVYEDEDGYMLNASGDAETRTIETVKMYLALCRAGLPVYLNEARELADRMLEKEEIGIVPEGIIPAYCENWFPNQNIIDFMNLPYEDREEFLPHCKWFDEEEVKLIDTSEQGDE